MAITLAPIGNFQQFFNNLGKPLSGGKIFVYAAGSFSVKAVTWSNRSGVTENPNPIVLDSSGWSPKTIWIDDSNLYQFVLTLPDGTTVLKIVDNVAGNAPGDLVSPPAILTTYITNRYINDNPSMYNWNEISSTDFLQLQGEGNMPTIIKDGIYKITVMAEFISHDSYGNNLTWFDNVAGFGTALETYGNGYFIGKDSFVHTTGYATRFQNDVFDTLRLYNGRSARDITDTFVFVARSVTSGTDDELNLRTWISDYGATVFQWDANATVIVERLTGTIPPET